MVYKLVRPSFIDQKNTITSMFDYKNYRVKDLMCDDSFQKLVLSDNIEDKRILELWLNENPDKKQIVIEARETLLFIISNYEKYQFTEQDKKQTINQVIRKLELLMPEKQINVVPFFKTTWFSVAASSLIIMGLGIFVYLNNIASRTLNNYFSSNSESNIEVHTNNTGKPKLITLSDGSSILLQTKSSISVPSIFNTTSREVNLSGEAFFEIAKDKMKPFYIYANGLTTKVHGTSFTICAYKKDNLVKVTVKTGKVTIYADKSDKSENTKPQLQSEIVDLMPNQQATFKERGNKISVIEVPSKILREFSIQQQLFEFDKAPIPQVLATLEQSYGIKMVSEEMEVNSRTITASLDDKPFIKKLELICELIDASYEQKDNAVFITSNN